MGNYGGMLQAIALSNVVECVAYTPRYINLDVEKKRQGWYWFVRFFLRRILHNTKIRTSYPIVLQEIITMVKSWLCCVDCEPTCLCNLSELESSRWIIGSDQVWRAGFVRYYGPVDNFFLSNVTKEIRNLSISYSASFGSDEWEGSPEETEECGRLLREFKAVSVREHSGVKICKDVFGVDAVQMPDPTLLLHPEDYGKIIDSEKTWFPEGKYVAAYILDETAGKAELLQNSVKSVDMQLQHLMPHADAKKRRDRFPISVPQWLSLIRDCEYFITDSFHGCVFAIIYNKPFVCLGNEGRGNARFDTLLGTFGLEDRMITDATPEKVLQILNTPIDWAKVNAIHDAERERGINFLKENLT